MSFDIEQMERDRERRRGVVLTKEEGERVGLKLKEFFKAAYDICASFHNLGLELDRYSRWNVDSLEELHQLHNFVALTVEADFGQDTEKELKAAATLGHSTLRSLARVLETYEPKKD